MPFPKSVTTCRLRLQRWDVDAHTPALTALNAQPATVTYLNDGIPYTPEQSLRQSERFAAHWDQHGFGLWATEATSTGAIIGFTGVCHPLWFPDYAHEVEAGWRLDPSHWGHGYATEAAHVALEAAFNHLLLQRVIAVIDPANTPSIAVATRIGMTVTATVPHPQHPGAVTIFATTTAQLAT